MLKPVMRRLSILLALFLLALALPALADVPDASGVPDAGTERTSAVAPSLDPVDDLGALASLTIAAIRTGNWWALAAIALSVVVSITRRFAGDRFPWLATDRGGVVTVAALSLFGALATALLGGVPIGPLLLIDALKVAATSIGGFVGLRKVMLDPRRVEEAASAASAASKPAGVSGVVGSSKRLGS